MKTTTLKLICIFLLFVSSCVKKEPVQDAPPDIPVYQIKAQQVPIYREYVGQVFGFKDIAIRARVEGFLEGIHFDEGSRIKKGILLYTLESQPFEAEVAAKMSKVAQARTMLAKAESDLNRIRPLAEQKAVSESDLDAAVAQYEAYQAEVDAAKANLDAANIQLGYTKIYSPVTGIIGKTKAKVGDFVGRSPNPVILNTVSRIDTVLVQFFITETEYLRFIRRYVAEDKPVERGEGKVELELILVDETVYEHKGKVDFIDREVNPATGAMLIQASFPNPKEILRPGQFAKVNARLAILKDGILIPQRCVMELQGLYNVYVVDETNKVTQKQVEVGHKTGQFWLITEGLKDGQHVVYEGLQKVEEGLIVNPVIEQVEMITEESD